MTELDFAGYVAIVTGAGRRPGLGRSYARLLAARGAAVVVNDVAACQDGKLHDAGLAQLVVDEILDEGGTAMAVRSSVADPDGARAVVRTALDEFGRLDIVINNAGVNIPGRFDEISDVDVLTIMNVHLLGTIWVCRAAWPHLVRSGRGRIVNTGSGTSLGLRGFSYYGAAKGGLTSLTYGLAAEGAEHGIKANLIVPSADTAATDSIRLMRNPEQHRMSPDQVAPVAVYLAHETCEMTGSVIRTVGGHFNEMFVSETRGWASTSLTIEDVRDHVTHACDRHLATEYEDPITRSDRFRFADTVKPYATGVTRGIEHDE